jgi:hypothetical protein
MELRRFFRAPLLLIAVAVLLLLFVLDYANSGSTYKQVDTSRIVTLIDQGQVKSALVVTVCATPHLLPLLPICRTHLPAGRHTLAQLSVGTALEAAQDIENTPQHVH